MERAKLSGELLVSKIPPHAGRPVQQLLSLADDAEADAFGVAPADRPKSSKPPSAGRKMAFRIAAIGAVLVAVGTAGGWALRWPAGARDPVLSAAAPAVAIPAVADKFPMVGDKLPTVADGLARGAVARALQAPALQPMAIVLPGRDPGSPAAAAAATAGAVVKPRSVAAPPRPAPIAAPAKSIPAAAAVVAALEAPKAPAVTGAVAAVAPARPAAPISTASPLRAQGDALFAAGRIGPARLFYERAAEAGDGRAALQLGETYDPAFLAQAGIVGADGNPTAAAYWYRRASSLGAADAALLLKAVMAERGGAAASQ